MGKWLVPQIEYESLFLRDYAKRFVDELGKNRVIYIGGADSVEAIETVLADGCVGVQLGRPLIREPWFVRRMERADDDGVKSLCVRCNYCTLSSIDPVKFPYGCIFLREEEGTDIEDIKKKTQSLIQVSMKLGEAVYKSQQKPNDDDKGTGGPKDSKPEEKENVVDADFEDVKEDKEKSA